MKQHTIGPTGELLCGCGSFAATMTSGREGCHSCTKRLEGLLYALEQLATLPGAETLARRDRRVQRALDDLPRLYGVEHTPDVGSERAINRALSESDGVPKVKP